MNPAFKIALFFSVAFSAVAQRQSPAISAPQRENALRLEQQGSFPQAEEAWRAILKTHPQNAEACAHLGFLEARKQNYKDAIPLYRKALALGPDAPGLRMNLGLALFKTGDQKEAIREFTALLNSPRTSPSDALRLDLLIGMAHYAQGQYADAVPFFQKAAAADPSNLQIRLVLAHSCLWSKQNQCVLDTYKEILNLDPDSAEACVLAGEALDAMQNTTGAIEQFRLAIKANPRLLGVHFGLGYLLWTQKDYDEASKEFQAELAINPDYGQALLYLGDIYVKGNRFAEALPLLERAVKELPTEALAHLDLGIVMSETGQPDNALRELNQAAQLDPTNADAHWRLSRIYRSRGETQRANEEFAKTRELKKAEHEDLYRKLANAQPPAPDVSSTPAPNQKP